MRTNRRKLLEKSCFSSLNYIQNNSDAYIDTGIIPSQNTELCIELSDIKSKDDLSHYIGVMDRWSPVDNWSVINGFGIKSTESSNWGIYFGTGQKNSSNYNVYGYYYSNKKIIDNTRYIIEIKSGVVKINKEILVSLNIDRKFKPSGSLYLFKTLNLDSSKSTKSNFKLHYLKLYNNGVMVRYFIPVYRKNDGKIGLLDKIEGKFYTSPNGVEFTGG